MTQPDRAFLVSEAQALVNDLSSAASRQKIRSEHVALTAAATRAQRILIMLERDDTLVTVPVDG